MRKAWRGKTMRRNLERQAPIVWKKPPGKMEGEPIMDSTEFEEDEDDAKAEPTTRTFVPRNAPKVAITCRQGCVSTRRFYAFAHYTWNSSDVAGGPQKLKLRPEKYRYNFWGDYWPSAGQDFLNNHDEIVCKVYGRLCKGATWTCVRKPISVGEKQEFTLDATNCTVGAQTCEQIRVEFVSCPLYTVSIHYLDLPQEQPKPESLPGLKHRAHCVWSPDSQAPFCGNNRYEKRSKRGRNREVRQLHRGRRYDLLGQDIHVEKREVDQ